MDIKAAMTVKTRSGGVWHLGPADEKGERDISRDGTALLDFTRGTVENVNLVIGEEMLVNPAGNTDPDEVWVSTPIVSIEPA